MTTISDGDGVEVLVIPDMPEDDYAKLASWFGGYGNHFEHYRKMVLSMCTELERAKRVVTGEKITETRLEHLARISPIYQDYILAGLHGKDRYNELHLKQGGIL